MGINNLLKSHYESKLIWGKIKLFMAVANHNYDTRRRQCSETNTVSPKPIVEIKNLVLEET